MKKEEKIPIVTFLVVFVIVSIIGYLFKIDILIPLLIRKDGFTIGFTSIFLGLLAAAVIHIISKSRKNKI